MTRTQDNFSPTKYTESVSAPDMTPSHTPLVSYGAIGTGRVHNRHTTNGHHSYRHTGNNHHPKAHNLPNSTTMLNNYQNLQYSMASNTHANPNVSFSLFSPPTTNGQLPHYQNGQSKTQIDAHVNGQSHQYQSTPARRPPPGFPALQRTDSQGFVAVSFVIIHRSFLNQIWFIFYFMHALNFENDLYCDLFLYYKMTKFYVRIEWNFWLWLDTGRSST